MRQVKLCYLNILSKRLNIVTWLHYVLKNMVHYTLVRYIFIYIQKYKPPILILSNCRLVILLCVHYVPRNISIRMPESCFHLLFCGRNTCSHVHCMLLHERLKVAYLSGEMADNIASFPHNKITLMAIVAIT